MTDRISSDEVAYHQRLVAMRRAWEQAWGPWARHLAEKYELAAGDDIDEAGVVHRAAVGDRVEAG